MTPAAVALLALAALALLLAVVLWWAPAAGRWRETRRERRAQRVWLGRNGIGGGRRS